MATKLTANLGGITLCAELHEPKTSTHKPLLFCLPGGGLTRDYFDLAPEYSFVTRMTDAGYSVITMDHPGIATNALPSGHPYFTPRDAARYLHQAFTPRDAARYLHQALSQWCNGSPVIGIGHSMGGMMIMLMQGAHGSFSGLGLFGSSAGGLDWGLSEDEKHYINQEANFKRDLEKLALAKFGGPYSRASGGPSGESITFGGETAELTKRLREISCEMNSASAMMSMMRGSFKTEVEAIDVPIFFAFGDHDIGIPPEDVPKDFANSKSTEVIILENTGHNHFAFSSIQILCQRLSNWLATIP